MKVYGNGGRGGSNLRFSERVLDGVLSDDVHIEPLPPQKCANPRCRRLFRPRAEGDNYCREACDLDSNPQFRGRTDQ